jgi:hypothetical protein
MALVAAAEASLARRELDLGPLAAMNWGLSGVEAAREAVGAEILCLGDSQVKCGIAPAVLRDRLGLTAYNLGAIGAPPPAAYFLLVRALAAGARPRAIVLDAGPTSLPAADFRGRVRNWAALIGPRHAALLARVENDPGFLGLHLVHYLVPSIRMRLDLREAITAQFAGTPAAGVSWGAVVARQHAVNRGAFLKAPTHPKDGADPYPDGRLASPEAAACYPEGWGPHSTNLVFLDRTLALASSRGIPVFFLVAPIHPGVQATREARGLDDAYMAIVRKIGAKYANVTVVDGRHAGFGHGAFADSHHLTPEGAAAQTAALAEVIAARLESRPGARWVELPRFAVPAALPAIEDLEQSKLALAASRTSR